MSVSKFDAFAERVLKSMHVQTVLIPQGVAWIEGDVLHYRVFRLDKAGRVKVRRLAPVSRRARVKIDPHYAQALRAIQEDDS